MNDYQQQWREETERVLSMLRKTELAETIKWGGPVFMYDKTMVVSLRGFKEHFAVWFYDGVFLDDKYNRLINATEGKTKALRQLRFTKDEGIDEKIIRYYLDQAIANAKKGVTHMPEKDDRYTTPPDLLKAAFEADNRLEQKFGALTPFKQKEYIEYISDAKQEKTRLSRLEKIKPMILQGMGLHDKYR